MVMKLDESKDKFEFSSQMTKCLILCSNELLGASVEILCREQAELNVINVQLPDDPDLMQGIEHQMPDMIILDEGVDQNILSKLLTLFVHFPEIRIIKLGLKSNVLHVYRKQDIPITKPSDLISIILDQPISQ